MHPAGERRGFRQAAQAVLLLAPPEQCQVGGFQTGLGHGPDRLGQAPIGQEAAVVQDQGVPGGQAQRAPQPLGTLRRRLLAGRTVAHDDGPWQPEPLLEKAGQGRVDCHEGISAPRKATFEPSNIALGPTLLARHSAGLGEVLVAVVHEAPAELALGETRRGEASQIVAVVDFGTSAGEGRGPRPSEVGQAPASHDPEPSGQSGECGAVPGGRSESHGDHEEGNGDRDRQDRESRDHRRLQPAPRRTPARATQPRRHRRGEVTG